MTTEQRQAQQKKYRLENRASCLLKRAKHYAKKRKEPFDLTHEWIQERLDTGVCEVTGLPFTIASGPRSPWTPSLDQINPREGYTQKNCRVVVWIYNTAKQNWSDAEVRQLAEALTYQNLAMK